MFETKKKSWTYLAYKVNNSVFSTKWANIECVKQAAKIRKEVYRAALSKCIPAALPPVSSCKVCSSLERQCSYPSELQKHYSKGPICYDTHRVLKFNPIFWIHPWASAEVSGNTEEICTAEILQGRQGMLVRSPQTPLGAWPERSSCSRCLTPQLPLRMWGATLQHLPLSASQTINVSIEAFGLCISPHHSMCLLSFLVGCCPGMLYLNSVYQSKPFYRSCKQDILILLLKLKCFWFKNMSFPGWHDMETQPFGWTLIYRPSLKMSIRCLK